MTPGETLLPKLASWQPAGEGRHEHSFPLAERGWTIHLVAERVDSLGCRLFELRLKRDNPHTEDIQALTEQARRAAARIKGLLEPLRLLEVDRETHVALLRSEGPPVSGDHVQYYEIRYDGRNSISVRRYQAARTSPAGREAIPYALTHEVISMLVEDLMKN